VLIETTQDEYRKRSAIRQLAGIYERLQKKEEALKCWRELLSMATNDDEKREAQGRIKMLTSPPEPSPALWPPPLPTLWPAPPAQ
jgi:hypothetical protein